MFTACWLSPDQTRSAASTDPPVISADASYMSGKTGLSGESKPCPAAQPRCGARRTDLQVRRVVHEGEQLLAGRLRGDHRHGRGVEHAEPAGQRDGQRQPDRVQRVVAAEVVAEVAVVPTTVTERRARRVARLRPVATGRSGSVIHSLHEPA